MNGRPSSTNMTVTNNSHSGGFHCLFGNSKRSGLHFGTVSPGVSGRESAALPQSNDVSACRTNLAKCTESQKVFIPRAAAMCCIWLQVNLFRQRNGQAKSGRSGNRLA